MSIAPPVAVATVGQPAHAASPRAVSTLMYACQQGDVDRVRRVLRAQPTAYERRDRTGKTALHYCCTSDNICAAQAADLLVMAAPDLVETRDEDGFTPLHLAVIAGNMPLVTFLLANNADVNAVDSEQHTVVHWAAVCGETGALRAILSAGAPVSTPDVHGGYPLHYAAQMCGGDKDSSLGLQVLQTLLQHPDVKVNVEDGDGRQPLLWAASAGSAKAVLALIRAGATVEAPDKDGLTALHCAASRGHTDCIDTLLTLCGMSPDVIDSNGCTALHYAVTLGHADATALLLAHGADANRQDRKGRSPAHCGCAKGQFETVKMIGAREANLWLRNARGDLPLHEAAASGRRDLVKWLLEARPSQVNARNNDGRCPLHLAALNDNADMCKILLDAGARINPVLRTSKNIFMTPLDCALQRGFRSTAKYLQVHGGVPASRVGTTQAANIPNGGLHLKTRETPPGETSDSERENGPEKSEKARRKHRRKFAEKTRISQQPESGGESKDKSEKKMGPEDEPKKESVTYNSEVKITNNYGGINIEKNGEIIIGDGSPYMRASGKLDPTEETTVDSKAEENKEGGDPNNNGQIEGEIETIQRTLGDIQASKPAIGIDENIEEIKTLANTIEQTAKSITKEVETIQQNLQDDGKLEKTRHPDQHSLMSNTSVEEGEQPKDLLVEAAVHEPPKTKKSETPKERRDFKRQDTMREQEPEEQNQDEGVPKNAEPEEGEAAQSEMALQEVKKTEGMDEPVTEEQPKELAARVEETKETEAPVEQDIEAKVVDVEDELPTKEPHATEAKVQPIETIEEIEVQTPTEEETKEIQGQVGPAEKQESMEKVDDVADITQTEAKPKEPAAEEVPTSIDDQTEQEQPIPLPDDLKIQTKETDGEKDLKAEVASKPQAEEIEGNEDLEIKTKELQDNEGLQTQTKEPEGEKDMETQTKDVEDLKAQTKKSEDDEDSKAQTEDSESDLKLPAATTEELEGGDEDLKSQERLKSQTKDDQDLKVKKKSKSQTKIKETPKTQYDGDDEDLKTQAKISKDSKAQTEEPDLKTRTKGEKDKAKEPEGVTAVNVENKDEQVGAKREKKSFVKRKKPKTDAPSSPRDATPKPDETEKKMAKTKEVDEKPKRRRPKATKAIEKIIEVSEGTPAKDDGRQKRVKHKDPRESSVEESSDESSETLRKEHRSFTVLDDDNHKRKATKKTRFLKKGRSRSDDSKFKRDVYKQSKIPTPVFNLKKDLSKSDRYLDRDAETEDVPSLLPNLLQKPSPRSESNLSAPLRPSVYSDNERSASDMEETRSATKRRRLRKRIKIRDSKSAGSDYESSNLIDSGFEPSPRSSRIPKWRNMSERGVNMTSITQNIQSNIRRYHLERKIFQHLLELKRLQIRSGQHNEAILVKRAIDDYHNSCASTVGAGRYVPQDYSFKSFEKFLYHSLKKVQKNGSEHLEGLPESPLLCTQSTHRCLHATHAYTGIPCAAYLPRMDHHSIPKIGFCKPSGFLPHINPKKAVTLELCHGNDKQVISLPTDRLDQNKRYYVTFTVKGQEHHPAAPVRNNDAKPEAHRHAKSI